MSRVTPANRQRKPVWTGSPLRRAPPGRSRRDPTRKNRPPWRTGDGRLEPADGRSRLLRQQRFQLLEVVLAVRCQLVAVQILVAALAGVLLPLGLRIGDHLLHHLLRLGPATLGAGLRGGAVARGGDGALVTTQRHAAAHEPADAGGENPGEKHKTRKPRQDKAPFF